MSSILRLAAPVFFLVVPCASAAPYPRYWQPVTLDGATVPELLGHRVDQIAALRCDDNDCEPIPFQFDERTADGEWALAQGAAPTFDESPGVLDENDAVVFLVDDAGNYATDHERAKLPPDAIEVKLTDPLGYPPRYVYLAVYRDDAPRSPVRYVSYDPAHDRLRGRVEIGYADGVPKSLELTPGGSNILDRFEIRATATFLWGLIRITRSEADLIPQEVTWSAGPIRVIRRQPLQLHMVFGLRSPRFLATTFFYRDFAELPLAIRLRVPPRYLFTSITVWGGLDFRDLPGLWHGALPNDERVPAGCAAASGSVSREGVPGDWFAIESEAMTIVQRLQRGDTLQQVRESVWYRNGVPKDHVAEAARDCPAAGFALEDWDRVEGGVHTLTSTSYAVSPGIDTDVFLATVHTPLDVTVLPIDRTHR